jgi:ABC-type sugar transport system ATPase subunit
LLDEPLSNLDAKLRVSMRAELKRLHHDLERTFIYVTHDQAEALTMSDRIAIMNHGQLQQYGTPDEVYYQPANLFVAGFIGSPPMNFVEGELVGEDGRLFFQWGNVRYALPDDLRRRLETQYSERNAILGVRSETIEVSRNGAAGLDGVVYVEEPLGSDVFVTVQVGNANLVVRTNPDFRAAIGDQLKLHFNPAKLYFFSPQTGQAIR